jgi:hypothetical protein
MIDQLSKIGITVISETRSDASKTIKCEICAVSKMHRLVQKLSATRTTKSYEMLHFDLIIYEFRRFDDITCIAHFTDEFTHYSWVFSLTDHKKKTFFISFQRSNQQMRSIRHSHKFNDQNHSIRSENVNRDSPRGLNYWLEDHLRLIS